ncbi:metal ABC transporter solute-binding protein, Zn/Mn family [Natronospora cellulosivora (SeqCode)]
MTKKIFVLFFAVSLLISFSLALSANEESNDFTIVTTFTILEDYARQVAGEHADVRVISPIGAEVHEWELTPQNFIDLEEADIVFYNGLNTEQWMDQVRAVVRSGVQVIALAEVCDYPTLPIVTGDYAGEADPHIWMDVMGAGAYVETIRDSLVENNPALSEIYIENTSIYLEKLELLHEELLEKLLLIPEENRILISSEAAFIYFADAYDFYHDGIWGTNTEEEGTPQQMMRIIQIIEKHNPKGIFYESTGSGRHAQSVSADTGVAVFGPLYVDSVDYPETEIDNYIDMMLANASLLVEVLK